jgi:SAM-dependent methyltransferase
MKPFDLIKETNLNLGTDFKSSRELWGYARIASDRIKAQWLDSGRTDYSIYKDPEYIYEGLICFDKMSGDAITRMERLYRAHNLKKSNLLDIYNGIGLTSVYATQCGFEAVAVNDNPHQVSFMQKTAMRHLGREIKVYDTLAEVPNKSFDIVMSLEVIEHFTEPMVHLQETLDKISDGGCLAESTGFADCTLPGHFEYYTVNGELIRHRQVSKIMADYLRTGYLKGVQCKPRVWGKIMVGYDKKPRVWREGAPTDAVTFHGHCREMDDLGLDHFIVQGIWKR